MKTETKLKNWTTAKWKKEFWRVFARYIKARDKHRCFTCDKICTGLDEHAGHFIAAGACGLELYFDEDNVHVQCYKCNINLGGNQYIYGQRLGKKSEELYDRYHKRNGSFKYSSADYARLIEEYEKKLSTIDFSN